MHTFDSQLASRLHHLAESEPRPASPTRLLLERGRRARRRRTAGLVAASCAILALGAIAVGAITAPRQPTRPGTTVVPESPRMRLAAAIAASDNTSYRVRFSRSLTARPGAVLTDVEKSVLALVAPTLAPSEGAFDPTTVTGYLHTAYPSVNVEQRIVNGERFAGVGGKFKHEPGTFTSLNFNTDRDDVFGGSADSARLLAELREQGSVTETAEDVYHFEVTLLIPSQLPPNASLIPTTKLTGEVVAGKTSKRIEKITYEVQHTANGYSIPGLKAVVTFEFSGYGTPVTVERPNDADILK